MKRLSILFLAVIFFSSCEKETYIDYYVDNQSSGEIAVRGKNMITSNDIDQHVSPNERKDVAAWSKRGKETDYFEPSSMFGDDLLITNASGDTLIKDYKLLSNWISEVDNRRAVASHEYVLVIRDSDF